MKLKQKVEIKKVNAILDWFVHMVGYALILIAVSVIFNDTMYIDPSLYGLWGLLVAIIIYLLNKTIKPFIVWLTLPITGITLGLFYPVINVIILKIVSFLLGNHFEIKGFFLAFVIALLISFMNAIMDELIIKPLLKKGE